MAIFPVQITKLFLHHTDRIADLFRKYVIEFAFYILQILFYFIGYILTQCKFFTNLRYEEYPKQHAAPSTGNTAQFFYLPRVIRYTYIHVRTYKFTSFGVFTFQHTLPLFIIISFLYIFHDIFFFAKYSEIHFSFFNIKKLTIFVPGSL